MTVQTHHEPSASTIALRRKMAEWQASGGVDEVMTSPRSSRETRFQEDGKQLRLRIQDAKRKRLAIDAELAAALLKQKHSGSGLVTLFGGLLRKFGW